MAMDIFRPIELQIFDIPQKSDYTSHSCKTCAQLYLLQVVSQG